MARTIAKAFAENPTTRSSVTRLGNTSSTGEANTWRTFSSTRIMADGSGCFRLVRDNKVIHEYTWGPEGEIQNDSPTTKGKAGSRVRKRQES